MASLLDKVSTLISANLHYMVDQALQNNSPAVIDQYIRQVEANLADLEDAAAAVGGEVKGIQRREQEFQSLLDAKVKLVARLQTMKAEREELTALLELAKSKETTVRAIKSLKDLTGSGDADIARIANSIRSRLDKASTASEMHAASLDEQMDEVLERSTLDAQLAERKKKLGIEG